MMMMTMSESRDGLDHSRCSAPTLSRHKKIARPAPGLDPDLSTIRSKPDISAGTASSMTA
jgi:hypothetical protein